eukprot:CAMPEP_0176407096 /NCGR_PEP_ID=MMETSP0127-20121128/1230_1 /TAXON_ID=938130 /ORGANISM="Platyophrya macrostoma, Strain WH" /LENGTH=152 /DNA_ID=CAMNT_0017786281 /DNA_START=191 /DNA_END=646 /DNA_ORIENTATION=+
MSWKPTEQRLTRSGAVDRRSSKNRNPEPQTAKRPRDRRGGTVLKREALESLQEKHLIVGEVVYFALLDESEDYDDVYVVPFLDIALMRGEKQAVDSALSLRARKKIILWPLFYNNHYILAVINLEQNSFEVFDSYREYAHDARAQVLERARD